MVQNNSARTIKSLGFPVLLMGLCVLSGTVLSETLVPGGFLSPSLCDKRVLYMVKPLMPRHVVLPESGCSVTVRFQVGSDGKLEYPLNSHAVPYDEQAKVAVMEPSNCNDRYVRAVLRSMPKSQFAASEKGYSCTYRYNWVIEQ
jgi:hypothetical protein